MMDAPLIEARALDKTFGVVPVLRGVNLKIRAGACAMVPAFRGNPR